MSNFIPNNSTIISESCLIKFTVLDNDGAMTIKDAKGFLTGLLASCDKSSLIFSKIVTARSIVKKVSTINVLPSSITHELINTTHEMTLWHDNGPFTFEQFLKMTQYPSGISNDEWFDYLNGFKAIKIELVAK
jgi:hypothetical protein